MLDPARSAQVVTDELDSAKDAKDVRDVKKAVLSCDRYSAYKKFARLHPGVVLAFCWAHQRRDFLELATRHPTCKVWALEWVDAIGQLYRLNAVRLQRLRDGDGDACDAAQAVLREACSVWSIGASTRWPIHNSPGQRARCFREWLRTGAG